MKTFSATLDGSPVKHKHKMKQQLRFKLLPKLNKNK